MDENERKHINIVGLFWACVSAFSMYKCAVISLCQSRFCQNPNSYQSIFNIKLLNSADFSHSAIESDVHNISSAVPRVFLAVPRVHGVVELDG